MLPLAGLPAQSPPAAGSLTVRIEFLIKKEFTLPGGGRLPDPWRLPAASTFNLFSLFHEHR